MDRPADETWFDRQPLWVSLPAFLLIWPFFLVYGLLVFAFLILVFLPVASLLTWRDQRRFMQKLRDTGRVVDWSEAIDRLSRDEATLLVELWAKGPYRAWLLDRARDDIDPTRTLINWTDFAERGWDAVPDSGDGHERIKEWVAGVLPTFVATAALTDATWRSLAELDEGTRSNRAITYGWCGPGLSHLIYHDLMGGR